MSEETIKKGMRVHIENDIYIQGSRMDFTVDRIIFSEKLNKKTGKMENVEAVSSFGSYPSLTGAINGVLRLKISESNAKTLTELVQQIKEWREKLTELVTI